MMSHSQEHQSAPSVETTKDSNQPHSVHRDGNLKAATWRNEGEHGPYLSTTFARTYKDDDGQYYDSQSFREGELLRISEMARDVYRDHREFRRSQHLNMTPDQTPDEIERDQRQYGTRRQEFQEKRQGGESRTGRSRKRT
jgi:hypothetical protein